MTEPAFVVVIDGVEVGFRDMTPGQITMASLIINRARKEARQVGEAQASINMLESILNMVESLVIDDGDRDHLMTAMLTGKMELADIYRILRRGKPDDPDDDEDVARPAKKRRNSRATA